MRNGLRVPGKDRANLINIKNQLLTLGT